MTKFKSKIRALRLIPSGGGCFEVSVDGDLLYSKLKTGEFPDESEILQQVAARMETRTRGKAES